MSVVRLLLVCLGCVPGVAFGETLARHGRGWLERDRGALVLHVEGTPAEMGEQHGVLLKESIRRNLDYLLRENGGDEVIEVGPMKMTAVDIIRLIVQLQRKHVPAHYWDELRGVAAGADLPVEDIEAANFIPELFHCSGFALLKSATANGALFHGRVLDYGVGDHLQDHAVVIVAHPEGGVPFVNVGYAGFIGSVTGMNAERISIGEMGGGGVGHWDGMPMAMLVREVLQTARTLDEAIEVFESRPRTCEYFYVIADGESQEAVGMEASWNRFEVLRPGDVNARLPRPLVDAVALSAGERYRLLVDRIKAGHGEFTAELALRLMDRPVAMRSNLHNALFETNSLRFWVANAGPNGEPAAEQKYQEFDLHELLTRRP
jgi:isopenicillin-N N-acyltransferase like protein